MDTTHSGASAARRQADNLDFLDGFRSMVSQRKNMTQTRHLVKQSGSRIQSSPDFLDVVSIICDIYQGYLGDLVPVQHFHPSWEREEDAGNTSIVTSRSISSPVQSATKRGSEEVQEERVIVKRTKKTVNGTKDSAVDSLVNELLIRSHPPLRSHPNIVDLKGIAWDFEQDDENRPRPLLIEEFAPHRSLVTFWRKENMVRMPFKVKASLCRDIAEGISALHACGVVHGDLKPDNILIFGTNAQRGPFTAKLTDFGSSVRSFQGRQLLPAWTDFWCAPEADGSKGAGEAMTFQDMMATDVYSYGLVAVSIVIGASIFSGRFLEFKDKAAVAAAKASDRMVDLAMDVVIREDRTQLDSDFDLSVVRSLLSDCLTKSAATRSLANCRTTLSNYEESLYSAGATQYFYWKPVFASRPIKPPPISQPPVIGYRTLSGCGYAVKAKIVVELKRAASDISGRRRAACAWELCICYFSGFGVERNWTESRYWLALAATLGLETAQAFFLRMHHAMDADPLESLTTLASRLGNPGLGLDTEADAAAYISERLSYVVGLGCVEVLPDLRRWLELGPNADGSPLVDEALATYRNSLAKELRMGPSTNNSLHYARECADLLPAVVLGDLETVQRLLKSFPEGCSQVDADGNTALILAARSGNFEVLDLLLQLGLGAGACNAAQQSALHFLAIFADEQIRNLVPRLVEAGADVSQEAQPVSHSTELSTFSVTLRSSPLLYAIIRNNMVLLEELAAASHSAKHVSACRVCEAGSRYRKILAVAISLHCYRAIDILQAHLKHYGKLNQESLHKIEIWYQDKPLYLHRVPFDGYVLRGLDLPDQFLRAVYYGQGMTESLTNTFNILLDKDDSGHVNKQTVYDMIQDSTYHGQLDALDYLLSVEFQTMDQLLRFSLLVAAKSFYTNPVFISMRRGNRSIFKRLVGNTGQHITWLESNSLCEYSCDHRSQRRLGFHYHPINMIQLCLSMAVTVSHFDQFFVDFLLEHCPPKMILAIPSRLDEWLTGQPAAFMAQAIFTWAKVSAASLVAKYPILLLQQVSHLARDKRLVGSESYTFASYQKVLDEDAIAPETAPLPEFIFFIGSEANCKMLQELRMQELARCQPQAEGQFELAQVTLGGSRTVQDWRDHPLTDKELHWLMTGLIAERRKDRYALWELARHQFELSQHSKGKNDQFYARLAVMYLNYEALICLGGQGWRLGRGNWLPGLSPLDLATYMGHVKFAFPRQKLDKEGKRPPVGIVYRFSKPTDEAIKRTVQVLEQQTGSHPLLPAHFKGVEIAWLFGGIHFLLLPLSIGYGCVAPSPDIQQAKWFWLYSWSLITLGNMFLLFIYVLRSGIFLTPWACYSLRAFPLTSVLWGWLLLIICFVLIGLYYVLIPSLLYSPLASDALITPFVFLAILAPAGLCSFIFILLASAWRLLCRALRVK